MRRTWPLLLVTGMAVASPARSAVEISLRDEVRLEGRTFTLGDIADLHDSDARRVSRLERVMLGRVPRTGVSTRIDRDAVTARLERAQPGISTELAWKGASAVRVQGVQQSFDRQVYLDEAQQRLDEWLKARYSDYSLRPVGRNEDLRLPAGEVALQTTILRADRVNRRMCVWVDLQVDGEHYSSIPVWFEVSAQSDVYTLRSAAGAGTQLGPRMLQRTRYDLAKVSGTPVVDLTRLEGQRLTRDMPEGAVLTEAVLQPVPDVVKGQQIRVRASVGKVTLVARARALADGNRGDPVRVERLDGQDSYMTRVIGDGLAEVVGMNR
jgi:flagellar basal body P-ring formation protein FlgA